MKKEIFKDMAKIGCLTPTRGDRPKFIEQCKRLMAAQTLKPNEWEIVDDKPLSDEVDITYRFRIGFERLKAKGVDVIIIIEDDDYYSPTYIETMFTEWVEHGKPLLFGIGETTYYHLGLKAFSIIKHDQRASAMSTMVSTKLPIEFPKDSEPFFDLHLWKNNKGVVFFPKETISIGIKHGIGKCGGKGHLLGFRYDNQDAEMNYLKSKIDNESFKFYKSLL